MPTMWGELVESVSGAAEGRRCRPCRCRSGNWKDRGLTVKLTWERLVEQALG